MASNSFCRRSAGGQGSIVRQPDRLARRRAAEGELQRAALLRLVLALRHRQQAVDRREHPRAVALERVEGAGRREAFQHALVDGARIDAAGEVRQVGERPVAARRDDGLDRLPADAFERRQRVVDGVALDVEGHAGAVDRRRLDLDAEPLRLGAELRQLVGIAHIQGHRRGQEFDRVVGLHVGGLVGDQRIGGGVALVEAVVGELLQQFEDRLGLALARCRARRSRRRSGSSASASRRGSSCPWRGAAGRPRRASSPTASAPSASPVPGRR